jgi:dGTPase
MLVDDVLKEAQRTFAKLAPKSSDDLRKANCKVISFSDELNKNLDVIRSFLFERMYRAPSVLQMRDKVTIIIKDLFAAYSNDPSLLPQKWQEGLVCVSSDDNIAGIVCDYIAGMTDRFAISQHEKLFGT